MRKAGSSNSPSRASMAADETRYKGVRKRKWGKWVSEVRLPNSRERIWLGSYDTPEKAARAFDAAQFCLRGRSGRFNFPDNPPNILGGRTLTRQEIRLAAARYANTEPSVAQHQQQHEEEGMMAEPSQTAEERDVEGEGEEELSPSRSLSLSEGTTVQMENDATFDGLCSYPCPCLDPLTSMGSGNYVADYGLISGFDDYNYGHQTLDFGYGGEEENYDGSPRMVAAWLIASTFLTRNLATFQRLRPSTLKIASFVPLRQGPIHWSFHPLVVKAYTVVALKVLVSLSVAISPCASGVAVFVDELSFTLVSLIIV
ncbi:hypothetical protein Ancab_027626 [Ancistrocladus abbreviatus]